MKTRLKVLALVLTFVLASGTAITASAEPYAGERHIELKKAGEFTKGGIRVMYDAFLEGAGENSAYAYDINGQKISSEAISRISYLEGGMYQLGKADATDVNSNALANSDGKILIPFENAMYTWPSNSDNSGIAQNRFITVFTGTEETKNEGEALFYTTSEWFSMRPGEDDIMYKGFARIYDTQNEKFVDNIRLELVDKYDTINIVGDSILIKNPDSTYTLYDADGKVLKNLNSRAESNGLAVIEKAESGSGYSIFDDTGKQISNGGGSPSCFSSTSGYFSVYEDHKYTVMDITGKQVSNVAFDIIYQEDHDLYRVQQDDKYQIVDGLSGKVLAESDKNFTSLGGGFFALETGEKEYTLVGPSGIIAEKAEEVSYGDLYAKDGNLIALNDGSAFLKQSEEDSYKVLNGVLYVESGSGGPNALYDLLTGKKLLDDGFSSARMLGDRLLVEYHDASEYTYKTYDINIVDGK